jgi:peptidoglycan/xylan/chitin deacetylase (PgdA/CDA1 family)
MVTGRSSDRKKPIYVLLYHPWLEGFEDYFVLQLSWLRRHGFESISLPTLGRFVNREETPVPDRPIVITFDDGTIENYTVVYPLLKEYGFSGTVFAPTADHYMRRSGVDWWKEVTDEKVLEIEGHSHSHALAYINDQIEDFYPGRQQEVEPPLIKDQNQRHGAPIFGLGHELVSRRFIPYRAFVEACVSYFQDRWSGAACPEDWKDKMFSFISAYSDRQRGRYETDEEIRDRIREEVELSKSVIEHTIGNGKRVDYFAYPFGAYDARLIECLKSLGYVGAFTTDPGGIERGDNPFLLKRMMILAADSFGGIERILESCL